MPKSHWLVPEEKTHVCGELVGLGLLKWDNARGLPLKSGGKTDIYVNLRDARNDPRGIRLLTALYSNPLGRLAAPRFAEVPDSVSCFAGPLAVRLDVPYVTIREQAKPGRVAKAAVIGTLRHGEHVPIIDDVVTDGASKIAPYRELVRAGVRTGLVVLVDRQQGWKRKFAEERVDLDVWAGMSLHDVRRFLVERGLMQRCDPAREEANPLVVALDGKDWDDVLPVLDRLRTTGCVLKVNDLLFAKGLDALVPDLSVYGRVMADVKAHDIPNTVANIARRTLPCPPWAITVHASGGEEMMRQAVNALKDVPTKVLAVTVLTSLDKDTGEEIYSRLPLDQVKVLARIAARAGVHGFVCSPHEARELKAEHPTKIAVTPGVRSPGVDAGDQARVATPREARDNGANYVVGGRQFLAAADPAAEVERVLTQELGIQA